MNHSETIIFNLSKHPEKEFSYKRVIRNLYKFEVYEEYFKALKEKDKSFNFSYEFFKSTIEKFIDSIKDESFNINKLEREERDLIEPLVSKILSDFLDAIFSGKLSEHVHSFREGRNVHTALLDVKQHFKDAKFFYALELDREYFNLDRKRIREKLREKISDEKFIRFINKFTKSSFLLEDNTFSNTLYGSDLFNSLSNIFLSDLDYFLGNQKDLNFVRYANTVLVGFNENYNSFLDFRNELLESLKDNYNFDLEKIERKPRASKKKSLFLGYELKIVEVEEERRVILYVPKHIINKYVVKLKLVKDITSKPWKTIHRNRLLNYSDLSILKIYSSEVKRTYDYYVLATNVSQKLGQFHYAMEYSCLKTLARKHRTSLKKIRTKLHYKKIWGIVDPETGRLVTFYKGFKKKNHPIFKENLDILPRSFR